MTAAALLVVLGAALAFSSAALRQLGVQEAEITEVEDDIRHRDAERLQLQLCGDISSGIDLMHGGRWTPAPLTRPQRTGTALNEEAAEAMAPDAGDDAPPGLAEASDQTHPAKTG